MTTGNWKQRGVVLLLAAAIVAAMGFPSSGAYVDGVTTAGAWVPLGPITAGEPLNLSAHCDYRVSFEDEHWGRRFRLVLNASGHKLKSSSPDQELSELPPEELIFPVPLWEGSFHFRSAVTGDATMGASGYISFEDIFNINTTNPPTIPMEIKLTLKNSGEMYLVLTRTTDNQYSIDNAEPGTGDVFSTLHMSHVFPVDSQKFSLENRCQESTRISDLARIQTLRNAYGFFKGQSYIENWQGLGYKWFQSSKHPGWFYLDPHGGLWAWKGDKNLLGDQLIANLSPEIYVEPSSLVD